MEILENTTETRRVRKRDGNTLQPFALEKVIRAIQAALGDCQKSLSADVVTRIATEATAAWGSPDTVVDVEEIQDAVEVALMRRKLFDVAKAYILYRQKRANLREERQHPDPLAVSDYIHAGKYARYLPEQKRREVYVETVHRDRDMHIRRFSHIPGMTEEITKAFSLVEAKRVLPSMRSMQFGGPAIEANHNRIYNCSFSLIDRPRAFAEALYLLLCGCGVGFSVQFEHVDKLPTLARIDEDSVVHYSIVDSIEGWADALDALIHSYIDGTYVEFDYSKIRPRGAPLKTSGGKAPGHIPLKKMLERVRAILHAAQGRNLRPLEAHEIICHAADSVLSGGVRRSALISLFSLDDSEMMQAKTGNWFATAPWRQNANNSVMLKRDDVKKKAFQRVFKSTRSWGEPGFYFCADYNYGSNPCQPENAPVLTPTGIRLFRDVHIGDTIWAKSRWTRITNKVMTGVKPVYCYHTTAGRFLGTEEHRVVSDGEKVEVRNASSIDFVTGPIPSVDDLDIQDVMDGLVMGDGYVHEASNNLVLLCIGQNDHDYMDDPVGTLLIEARPGVGPFAWTCKTTITSDEIPMTYNRVVPDRFYHGDIKKVRGFLRGLYSANGSIVSNRVTLKASSFSVVCRVQEMLSSIGIRSYYTTNQAHDVTFDNGTYLCRESYDLNITGDRTKFRALVGFIQTDKKLRLDEACQTPTKTPKLTYDIMRKDFLGEQRVWDIAVEDPEHVYWTGGLLVSNCVEIGLNPTLTIDGDVLSMLRDRAKRGKPKPKEAIAGKRFTGWAFCNLSTLNMSLCKSLAEFEEAAQAAALIGTLQASYTDMPYLGWVSEVIAEREALLGVSMTGIMDSPDIAMNPEYQRIVAEKCVEWNTEYARRIGIRPAARVTCVKPEGTSSKALGCVGNGHHPHHARRYILRVIAKDNEPQFVYFKSINPHMVQRKPNGDYVIEFPVEAPPGAVVKDDVSAVKFLEMVRSTQINWVLAGNARPNSSPGLTHNVSNTVRVKSDEWDDAAEYIWEHREHFTGVALLGATGDKDYAFSPQEEILTEADEIRWNQLLANYKPVDYSKMVEEEDTTDLMSVAACSSDKCEIVVG